MALLVDSRYKIPWIIWKRECQFTIPANFGYEFFSLAHGLPFTPLLLGQWSYSSNFLPSYDLQEPYPGWIRSTSEYSATVGADATHVRFALSGPYNQSSTLYFRLMAFAPPGYTGEITPVEYPNSKLTFSSAYRYQKIYMSGTTTANQTIVHNLGYIPQARAWNKTSISDGSTTYQIIKPENTWLTATTLKFNQVIALQNETMYYHIYKDGF